MERTNTELRISRTLARRITEQSLVLSLTNVKTGIWKSNNDEEKMDSGHHLVFKTNHAINADEFDIYATGTFAREIDIHLLSDMYKFNESDDRSNYRVTPTIKPNKLAYWAADMCQSLPHYIYAIVSRKFFEDMLLDPNVDETVKPVSDLSFSCFDRYLKYKNMHVFVTEHNIYEKNMFFSPSSFTTTCLPSLPLMSGDEGEYNFANGAGFSYLFSFALDADEGTGLIEAKVKIDHRAKEYNFNVDW